GTRIAGGIGYASTALIQGPGQQGLCCLMAAKHAGADLVIVTGTSTDTRRLEVATAFGADYVIDVERQDPLARVVEITRGRGGDFGLASARGGGAAPEPASPHGQEARGGRGCVSGVGCPEGLGL